MNICDALRNLVTFVQFKKREKLPWKSDTFSILFVKLKPATLLKVSLLYGCFSHFLICANGTKIAETKWYKWPKEIEKEA